MSSSMQCGGCGSATTKLKFVSCLHALCAHCLQNSLGPDGCITCPQCFAATQLPFGLDPLRSLPNVVLAGDTTTGAAADRAQAIIVCLCNECWDDTPGTVVCQDCGMKFCDDHAIGHPKSKSGKGHTMKALAGSCTEPTSSSSRVVQHRCVLHTNEVLKQFCLDCNQLLCTQCVQTGAHRHDEHKVMDIASAAQNTRDALSTKLSSCTAECDGVVSSAIDTVETSIRTIHSQTELASEKVSGFFKPLAEAVKKREDSLLTELDKLRLKKLEPLEKQLRQLQECVSKGESAASIFGTFEDDVELLRVWSWVDESITRTLQIAQDEKEPCVASGIVFVNMDTKPLLETISQAGAVLDVADGTLHCPQQVTVNDQLCLSVELPANEIPGILEQEQLDNLGLEISISCLDKDTTEVCSQLTPAPGRIQTDRSSLSAGRYNALAKVGGVNVKGSPRALLVSDPPKFDGSRCGNQVKIGDDGHSLRTRNIVNSCWSSACTEPMGTKTGISTLKMRIDKTERGNVFLSACSASKPILEHYQQNRETCFGWYGVGTVAYHTEAVTALSQPWQTGDIIHLTVDHDRHTLTGVQTRTGATETISNVTGDLYWIISLYNVGDQITLI